MRWPRATRRRHRARLVELDLSAAVRAALDIAQPTLDRAQLELVVDVPEHLPARANPDALAQVLGNLISNAARYTPVGGTVTVRAERRPADLLVSIANTGEGIPPEDIDRVFERFYRVEKSRDRAHGGAGIGLAIVKQLVEAGRRARRRRIGRRDDALLVQPAGVGLSGDGDGDHPGQDARQPEPLDRAAAARRGARPRRGSSRPDRTTPPG